MPLQPLPVGRHRRSIEVERPRRIVEAGRGGKFNRIRTLGVYDARPGLGRHDARRFTLQTEPKTLTDRFLESLGARGWMKRKLKRSMRRLRDILEEDRGRGARPSIAGGARKPATGSPFAPIGSASPVSRRLVMLMLVAARAPSPSAACGNKEDVDPARRRPRASTSTSAT